MYIPHLQAMIQNPRIITEAYEKLSREEQEEFCCNVLDTLPLCHEWPAYIQPDLVYGDTGYIAPSVFMDKLFAPYRENGVSARVLHKYITNILHSVQGFLDAQRAAYPNRDKDEIRRDVTKLQFSLKVIFSGGLTPEEFSSKKLMLKKHFSFEFAQRFKVYEKLAEVQTTCDSLGVSIEDWLNGKYAVNS